MVPSSIEARSKHLHHHDPLLSLVDPPFPSGSRWFRGPSNGLDRTNIRVRTRNGFHFEREIRSFSNPGRPDDVLKGLVALVHHSSRGTCQRAPAACRIGANRHERPPGDLPRDAAAGAACTRAARGHLPGAVRDGLPRLLLLRQSSPRHARSCATRCASNTRGDACEAMWTCLRTLSHDACKKECV